MSTKYKVIPLATLDTDTLSKRPVSIEMDGRVYRGTEYTANGRRFVTLFEDGGEMLVVRRGNNPKVVFPSHPAAAIEEAQKVPLESYKDIENSIHEPTLLTAIATLRKREDAVTRFSKACNDLGMRVGKVLRACAAAGLMNGEDTDGLRTLLDREVLQVKKEERW